MIVELPGTRPFVKTIVDMMDRAVKAGFYQKMPDDKSSMHPDEYRRRPRGTFSRQTVISLLIFRDRLGGAVAFAPALESPHFAIPSFVRLGRSLMTITAAGLIVTVAARHRRADPVVRSRLCLAMAMYRSASLESYLHPMIDCSWRFRSCPGSFRGAVFAAWISASLRPDRVCGPVFLVDSLDAMRGVFA